MSKRNFEESGLTTQVPEVQNTRKDWLKFFKGAVSAITGTLVAGPMLNNGVDIISGVNPNGEALVGGAITALGTYVLLGLAGKLITR